MVLSSVHHPIVYSLSTVTNKFLNPWPSFHRECLSVTGTLHWRSHGIGLILGPLIHQLKEEIRSAEVRSPSHGYILWNLRAVWTNDPSFSWSLGKDRLMALRKGPGSCRLWCGWLAVLSLFSEANGQSRNFQHSLSLVSSQQKCAVDQGSCP